LEGHHLRGFGDGSSSVQEAEAIRVMPGALDEATSVLADQAATSKRMAQVLRLTKGYESAYGLELLSSVHWIAAPEDGPSDGAAIVTRIGSWSHRKKRMFTETHIHMAWNHLQKHGWLTPATAMV
jgi:hypothetical protein